MPLLSLYLIQQQVEDTPEHRLDVQECAGLEEGAQGMERRMEASDKLLQEVHDMVRGFQPANNAASLLLPPTDMLPATVAQVTAGAPATASAPVTAGAPAAASAPATRGAPATTDAPAAVATPLGFSSGF